MKRNTIDQKRKAEILADLAADYDMLSKDPQYADELREVEEGL